MGLASAALDSGDNVVATARRSEQLAALVTAYGSRVRTAALDVTELSAARAAVMVALDEFGSLEVVVNNAGYANSAAIEEMTIEDHLGGGYPKRAAQIIVDIVNLDHPPLRLLLGAGAVESAANSSRIRADEAEEWSGVSRSADFGADPVAVAPR